MIDRRHLLLAVRVLAFTAAFGYPAAIYSQTESPRARSTRPLFVNDEWERYARIRQIAGDAPLQPWTIRAFSARESRELNAPSSLHPWHGRMELRTRALARGIRVAPLDAALQTTFNSSFPYGYNDGPVWSGRGVTTVLSAGAVIEAPGVTLAFAPLAFRAENAPFALGSREGRPEFADVFAPSTLDSPQRFGDGAYQRLVGGSSRLEVSAFGVMAAVGTDDQHWGPARDHPLVLGNNAGGFPHVVLGSDGPVDLWIARVHTRLIWGRLDASRYRPRVEPRYRFATGMALAVTPRGVPGLELGFSRFFHVRWTDGVVNFANISRPFIGVVRDYRRTPTDPLGNEPDNQIASIFGRWVLPASGVEVYAELGKDDYNKDFRDLAMEPDHIGGALFGLQRVMKRDSTGYRVFRVEALDTRRLTLALNRPQSPFYVHGRLTQGHTNEGQILGSVAAFGGGALVLGVDQYDSDGRVSISASRLMRAEFIAPGEAVGQPAKSDVYHQLTLDGLRFRGRMAATFEVTAVYEANRYFDRDAFNLRTTAGVQYAW